jgi:hypothetical protein
LVKNLINEKEIKMKKVIITLLLSVIAGSVLAAGFQIAFLKSSQEVGQVNLKPILNCTYEVGYSGGYTFTARMNEWSCPINVHYSIEEDKWTR